jgi:hypothetical protein
MRQGGVQAGRFWEIFLKIILVFGLGGRYDKGIVRVEVPQARDSILIIRHRRTAIQTKVWIVPSTSVCD